mgnify:CR=1 FL=1
MKFYKTKKQLSFNFLLILFLSFHSIKTWDYLLGGHDWKEQCKSKSQAPIDISAPFTYAEADLQFYYNKGSSTYHLKNDGNNLLVEGDLGYIKYNGDVISTIIAILENLDNYPNTVWFADYGLLKCDNVTGYNIYIG